MLKVVSLVFRIVDDVRWININWSRYFDLTRVQQSDLGSWHIYEREPLVQYREMEYVTRMMVDPQGPGFAEVFTYHSKVYSGGTKGFSHTTCRFPESRVANCDWSATKR